jgi:type VI secretion system secreted protein VgrG
MTIQDFDITIDAKGIDCSDLTVLRFRGREAISELFRFELDVCLLRGHHLPDGIAPNGELTIVMTRGGTSGAHPPRYFHGMIEQISEDRVPTLSQPTFRLVVVPRAARLKLIEQQQILMDLTVVDLLRTRLELVGLAADISIRTHASYPRSEYIVQYGESDWALLCRHAEHHGISFWFEHDDDRDRMVIADQAHEFRGTDGAAELHFHARADEPDGLTWLTEDRRDTPSRFVVYDYNYRHPESNLLIRHDLEEGRGAVLEYGSHFKSAVEGELLARVRAEERACRRRCFRGTSTIWQLRAATRSTVAEQGPYPALELLIESVDHEAEFARSGASGGQNRYTNSFTAVTTEHTYRPLRRTPRPRIHGFVTGIIQGASADTTSAWLDAEGRYLVAFHFDVRSDRSRASRPCRMAQPFGGTTHGMHFPLRPGTEVIVGFADGDPDRPVILGAVPNALAPSPVTASNSTLNRMVTQSGAIFEIGERS